MLKGASEHGYNSGERGRPRGRRTAIGAVMVGAGLVVGYVAGWSNGRECHNPAVVNLGSYGLSPSQIAELGQHPEKVEAVDPALAAALDKDQGSRLLSAEVPPGNSLAAAEIAIRAVTAVEKSQGRNINVGSAAQGLSTGNGQTEFTIQQVTCGS